VKKLSALEGLPLTSLAVAISGMPKSELGSLERLDRLTALTLTGSLLDSNIPVPSGHPTVERLMVAGQTEMTINDLSRWPALRELVVQSDCNVFALLLAAARAPSLSSLEFRVGSRFATLPRASRELDPLPKIRDLTLRGIDRASSATDLAQLFPSLTRLSIECAPGTALDLSPLQDHPDLTIEINGQPAHPSP
jgi:hypothetical protein